MPDIMKMGRNPNYLGSWDLDELPGRELTVVIEKIVDEEVVANGQKETCTVIYWTDAAYKPMIANVTNKKTLCKLYKTKDTEKLKGKAVVIGVDVVKAFGGVHDALRIRQRKPVAASVALPKCEGCGKEIGAFGSMTAEQVAATRRKRYGKALCEDCARAAAEGAQE